MVKSNSKAEIARITKGLQKVVKEFYDTAEDSSTLTINTIRSRAEELLILKKDFLKNDEFWKAESKKVIREEVDKQNEDEDVQQQESPPPVNCTSKEEGEALADTAKSEEGDHNSAEETKEAPKTKRGGKRAGSEGVKRKPAAAKNRTNKVDADDEEDETPRKKRRTKPQQTKGSIIRDTDKKAPSEPASDVEGTAKVSPAKFEPQIAEREDDIKYPHIEDSESEMSEVLDLTPKKKGSRSGTGTTSKPKPKSKAVPKVVAEKVTKKKETTALSPEEEKIKSLQNWLLKCGVRKIWGKELKKFPTTKEKIEHLRNLLEEIGMTGRYSAEKAKKIKEERELAAEVEAVQAGASEWGLENSDKVQTRSSRNTVVPPTTNRRLVRAELAFLDNQSEDSDD